MRFRQFLKSKSKVKEVEELKVYVRHASGLKVAFRFSFSHEAEGWMSVYTVIRIYRFVLFSSPQIFEGGGEFYN